MDKPDSHYYDMLKVFREAVVVARQRRRVTIAAGIAIALLIGAHIGYRSLWQNTDAEISGSFKVTSLHKMDEIEGTRARLHPGMSKSVNNVAPTGHFTLVTVAWNGRERVHWPAKICNFHVLVAHPAGLPDSWTKNYVWHYSHLIDRAVEQYPEIPRRSNRVNREVFAGTVFGTENELPQPTLEILIQSANVLTHSGIRVGVLFTCDDELTEFQWLRPDPI